ncbi:hypothetical protein DAEQUDRAFT_427838 [Daedalea quercina L-15889]|uniref:Pentacotripeptide-repeat region of PRORP domain-containing protein n=1 Tax=Daedalea quercina L-15889 TaxID=1314783 RepID=A0A165NJ17_9APHY|nr:hypothetical protein DAEQUDRAFT_427838 [Daedalea quercina L-15889]
MPLILRHGADSRSSSIHGEGPLQAHTRGLARTSVLWGEPAHNALDLAYSTSLIGSNEVIKTHFNDHSKCRGQQQNSTFVSPGEENVSGHASTTADGNAISKDEADLNATDKTEQVATELCDDVDVQKEVVRRKIPEYPPFVRELVREAKDLLRKRGEATAMKRFHSFLDRMEDSPARFQSFEAAIRMFLREGCPMAAVTCYTRMTAEGFICPISLQAQMTVISLANRSPSPEEFFALLETWFQNNRYNERALQDMLFLIDDAISKDPAFIDSVAKLYLRCKRPGYSFTRETISWLVYVHARAGSKSSAIEWLDSSRHAAASSPGPYTSLLRFMGDSPVDEELYRWIVARMQELAIEPDLPFYNAVMSTEFAMKKYDNAFEVYALLRGSAEPMTTPDARTFAMLFRALRDMSQPRSFLTRAIERPRRAPSPRQLYQDMLRCHLKRTKNKFEGVLSATSLIPAIRVFLERRDYAAAFVVLKTMLQCDVPIDLVMYQRVLSPLMKRLKHELPLLAVESNPRSFWSYRFLGLASAPTRQPPTYNMPILDMILRIGMVSRLSLAYVAPRLNLAANPPLEETRSGFEAPAGSSRMYDEFPSARPTKDGSAPIDYEASVKDFRAHEMPSTLEVADVVDSDLYKAYSAVPVERILRRAILADRPASILAAMKEVNGELATAKEQMVGDLGFELSGFSTRKRKPRYVSFSETREPSRSGRKASGGVDRS